MTVATNVIMDEPVRSPPRVAKRTDFNPAAHGLRGIASMMVFWAHLLGGTAEHVYAHNAFYVALVWPPWSFGAWGVELFFAISGFVILPSIMRYSLGQFALRRFFRLYPLFFVFTALFVILNGLFNTYPALNTPTAVVAGFLFLNLFTHTDQLTPNAWSLTYEVMFYALAALGYFFFRRRSRIGTTILLLASCAFLFRYPIAVFFAAGAVVRLLYDAEIRPSAQVARPVEILLAMVCSFLAATHRFGFSQADMGSLYAWALMVATPAYFYLAIQPDSVSGALLGNRVIGYLGTISYSLYLIHPYTYYGTRVLFDRLGLFTDNWGRSMALFFLIATPITIAVTHVGHKLFEIGPYRWFFRQRIYRGATATD